jgi:hypothetical protein
VLRTQAGPSVRPDWGLHEELTVPLAGQGCEWGGASGYPQWHLRAIDVGANWEHASPRACKKLGSAPLRWRSKMTTIQMLVMGWFVLGVGTLLGLRWVYRHGVVAPIESSQDDNLYVPGNMEPTMMWAWRPSK